MNGIRSSVVAAAIFAIGVLEVTATQAQDKMDHSKMDHSKLGHGEMKMKAPAEVKEADVKGKINTIDTEGSKINVTHEPVPALGWPKMTMDLPVTRRVDLSAVKPGMDATFKLKQGRDKQFRVIGITPVD